MNSITRKRQESLEMDTANTSNITSPSSNRWSHFARCKSGVFLPRWALFVAIPSIVLAVIGVPLLIAFLSSSSCPGDSGSLCDSHFRRDLTTESSTKDAASAKEPFASRLSGSLLPISYDVQLQPFIIAPLFNFDGNVSINCIY